MCVPYTATQLMLRVSTHTHNSFRMFVSSRVILRIRPEKTNVSFAVNRITLQLTLWFLKISKWTKTTDDSFHGEFHVPIQSANTHTQRPNCAPIQSNWRRMCAGERPSLDFSNINCSSIIPVHAVQHKAIQSMSWHCKAGRWLKQKPTCLLDTLYVVTNVIHQKKKQLWFHSELSAMPKHRRNCEPVVSSEYDAWCARCVYICVVCVRTCVNVDLNLV